MARRGIRSQEGRGSLPGVDETIHIRPMTPIDAQWWRSHRAILYEQTALELEQEVARYFGDGLPGVDIALVAELGTTRVGFAELSIRAYAEGCSSDNVGYLEGWYVEESHRHVGQALVEAAEQQWARKRGCTARLASDTEATSSTQAHLAAVSRTRGGSRRFARRSSEIAAPRRSRRVRPQMGVMMRCE